MKKINVAELLKDCPKGTELYSPMYGLGILTKVTDRIHVKFPKEHNVKCFRPDGKVSEDGEIMLYPKDKTTWEGFVPPPCEFKDGDIVSTTSGSWIGITTGGQRVKFIPTYCVLESSGKFEAYLSEKGTWCFNKLATKEEKQKLFDAIKANGYKWNPETKTLEKLVVPKFKVGDRIRHKTTNKKDVYEVSKVYDDSYGLVGFTWMIYMKYQDQYELIPNKFDISTLKPFDKVLCRDSFEDIWTTGFYSHFETKELSSYYVVNGTGSDQCIPYNEETKHLIGTTDDCDDFYKTWE